MRDPDPRECCDTTTDCQHLDDCTERPAVEFLGGMWMIPEAVEQGVRVDVLRHNVATCPACRDYLWAEVTVRTKTSEARLNDKGQAVAFVSARPVAMTIEHHCAKEMDNA